MKKLFAVLFVTVALVFSSCGHPSGNAGKQDSTAGGSPDSAANNGIIPPSAAPGNAGNSSLADTAYKSKDSNKIHKDTSGLKR